MSPSRKLSASDTPSLVILNQTGLVPAPSRSMYTVRKTAVLRMRATDILPTPFFLKENLSPRVMRSSPRNILIMPLLKKAAGIQKGSAVPNKTKVGKLTRAQLEEIATTKEPDLTGADLDARVRTIAGSARSMGLEVEL